MGLHDGHEEGATSMIRSFSTSISADPVFCALSPMAQLLYFKLYMHPQNHLCGLFMYSVSHMAVDIQATPKDAMEALDNLESAGFVKTDRACNLVWVPEMAARTGDLSTEGNKVGIAVKKYLKGVCPRKSLLIDTVSDSLFNTVSSSVSDTPVDRVLLGSVSGTDSGSEGTKVPSRSMVVPRNSVEALAELVAGLGGPNAWDALQAPRNASSTGLPMNAENGWSGVWRALCEAIDKPTGDDLRKLGRWWALGGAAKCKKQRFNYLSNVDRITEWLAASKAWDGISDPTPVDERKTEPRKDGGRAIPDGIEDNDTMRKIRAARLEVEAQRERDGSGG